MRDWQKMAHQKNYQNLFVHLIVSAVVTGLRVFCGSIKSVYVRRSSRWHCVAVGSRPRKALLLKEKQNVNVSTNFVSPRLLRFVQRLLTAGDGLCCWFPSDMFDIWLLRLLWFDGGNPMCGDALGGGPGFPAVISVS